MAGEGGGGSLNFNTSFSDLNAGIFGQNQNVTGSENQDTKSKSSKSGTRTERLVLSQAGIEAIIEDILKSSQGLGNIFSEENVSGLYNTSVAKEATGDLVSQIVGELAKLTGVKKTTEKSKESGESSTTGATEQKSKSPGLAENALNVATGGLFGSGLF